MKSPASFRLVASAVLALTALLPTSARAAETPDAGAAKASPRLIISHGVFTDTDGQPVPATLKNLGDLIMHRYPPTSINLVGVENVVVDDVTLQWPPYRHDSVQNAVDAVLFAFAEATKHQKFAVAKMGQGIFVLTSPEADFARQTPRRIEVFNLKLYLEGHGNSAELEAAVREAEMSLQLEKKVIERITRDVAHGERPAQEQDLFKSKIAADQDRLQLLTQQLSRKKLSNEETSKRIDQLLQVVNDTLQKLSPGAKMPDYEYHSGTYLLIVIGSDTALDVTRKVVNALEKSAD
jgi:hypothetical protein